MDFIYLSLACLLLLSLLASIWRVMAGPSVADSILATQIFGTTAVAILLIFAQLTKNLYLQDVALVIALLSAITAVSFVKRAWADQKQDIEDAD